MNRSLAIRITIGVIGVASLIRWLGDDSSTGNGSPIVSVEVPDLSADAKLGKFAFVQHCTDCHGENAAGRNGIAPPLIHKIYQPNHHADQAFFLATKRGVRSHHWPFGDMPPLDDLSDQNINMIITYVRELQRANGIF